MAQPPIPPDSLEIVVLGSGTSPGVPMIGCDCAVCRSDDPRDNRYRASVAVRLPSVEPTRGRVILIDVSPEFRLAAVANRLERVDAVLLTHAHADHIMGFDDLRRYNDIGRETIPCYGNVETVDRTRNCFSYAERPFRHDGWPCVRFEEMRTATDVCGARVTPIPLLHGRQEILGFRIGGFAYCTDCSAIPPASRELLADLDVLIIDGLRYTPHPTHFNIAGALDAIADLGPRRAVLTHIAHEVSHAAASAELPDGVELAWDTMRLEAPA